MGLKASEWNSLEKLLRRRIPPDFILTTELAKEMAQISSSMKKQIGILVNRKGEVTHVIVGTHDVVELPNLIWTLKHGSGRLRGIRFIHTQRPKEPIPQRDLTYLVLLALDLVLGFEVREGGQVGRLQYAHIVPQREDGTVRQERVSDIGGLKVNFQALINALEEELGRHWKGVGIKAQDRAILISAGAKKSEILWESLNELEALARSDDIQVVDKVTQVLKEPDPKFFIGKGKLNEIVLNAMQNGANLLIFDSELTPAQVRNLADHTELRIIDRTQLILDIFARRAKTREGKIQVELAQLRYLLPRLGGHRAFSRLTGGIGGRGPGETKLEIDKRRVKERISRLVNELKLIGSQRELRRSRRRFRNTPVVALVGYTNAGKSTILNALTKSNVPQGDRFFETLDTTARRLRFPREGECVITDTVGFIQDLPKDLFKAFTSTLEELHDADLIVHVLDASSPRLEAHFFAVEEVLRELNILQIPILKALNKVDKISDEQKEILSNRYDALAVCALRPESLIPLVERIQDFFMKGLKIRGKP
mgnify:CR=1 FL=1